MLKVGKAKLILKWWQENSMLYITCPKVIPTTPIWIQLFSTDIYFIEINILWPVVTWKGKFWVLNSYSPSCLHITIRDDFVTSQTYWTNIGYGCPDICILKGNMSFWWTINACLYVMHDIAKRSVRLCTASGHALCPQEIIMWALPLHWQS